MAKAELGTKRQCPKCGTRFYDLGKDDPVTCISCEESFVPEIVLKPRRTGPVAEPAPKAKPEPVVEEKPKEEPAAETEEDVIAETNDDLLVEEDEEDAAEGASGLLEIDDEDDATGIEAEVDINTDIKTSDDK